MFGLCCYTNDAVQAEVAIWNMVRGPSPNHRNGERHTAWTFCPWHEKPGTCHTPKMRSPTLVLITHFAAEIILIAFLNPGCERLSLGFKCHPPQMYQNASNEFTHFLGILMVEQTLYFWDNTLSSGQQLQWAVSHVYDTWLFACYNMSRLPPTGPQWLTYVGLCFYIVWCNVKGVGDIEIQHPKIYQKQPFFLMGWNLCWPL